MIKQNKSKQVNVNSNTKIRSRSLKLKWKFLFCFVLFTTRMEIEKKNQQIGWEQIQSTIWFDLIIVFLLHKQVCFHLQKKKLIVFFQFFTNWFFFHSNHSGIILNVDIIVNWHKNVIGHSHEYYIKSKNRWWWTNDDPTTFNNNEQQ